MKRLRQPIRKSLRKKSRPNSRNFIVVISLFAIAGIFAYKILAASPTPVQTVSVRSLGPVRNPAAPNFIRDGGATTLLDGKIWWTFGDTLFSRKSVDGVSIRSNTAGYASTSQPTVISEPLDANGAPSQLIPFTEQEAAYNASSGKPDERYALWPSQILATSSNSAQILYTRILHHPGNGGLNYEFLGTGLASFTVGQTTATRLNDTFFPNPGPYFTHGLLQSGSYTYLYDCKNSGVTATCMTARTPNGKLGDRGAYTFWTGRTWSSDISQAVRNTPGSTSGFSVAYNAYLKSYVSIYSYGFSSAMLLRTAPEPQGPWSDPVTIYTAPSYVYATRQHPEFSGDGGRTIYLSYYRPGDTSADAKSLQLIKVMLNPDPATEGNITPVPEAAAAVAAQKAANSSKSVKPGTPQSTTAESAKAPSTTQDQVSNSKETQNAWASQSGSSRKVGVWARIQNFFTEIAEWFGNLFRR